MKQLLYRIADKITGNTRQSSDEIVRLAQRGRALKGELPPVDVMRLCMSIISQARKSA